MDLEYMKQLRNMYAEQHIVSEEYLNELKKNVCNNEATITPQEEPLKATHSKAILG